jgi:hypothetical protein
MIEKLSGADELRRLVNWCNNTTENVLDRYTAEELLTFFRAQRASDWDLTLDQWTPDQRADALQGKVPKWDESQRAIPSDPGEPAPKRKSRLALIFANEP